MNILAVLVNYDKEQLNYLGQVIRELRAFKKHDVTVIVNSNIPISVAGIDQINILKLDDYQLLPLTCRKVMWDKKNEYDIFIYGENDHLFLEKHVDNHIKYSERLPKNRIAGLIQYEEDSSKNKYYPGYHHDFEWEFNSVENHDGKKFARFNNMHQASFILTKEQLLRVGKKINFLELVNENSLLARIKRKIRKKLGLKVERQNKYSVKCKVNTDVFLYGGMKKLICISDFEDNLIHHLPNLYIEGKDGRRKLRSDSIRMDEAIKKMLNN